MKLSFFPYLPDFLDEVYVNRLMACVSDTLFLSFKYIKSFSVLKKKLPLRLFIFFPNGL